MQTKKQPHSIDMHDAAYVTIALVVFLAALCAIMVYSASPAAAQGRLLCAPWKDIKAKFAEKYHEVPTSSGVVTDKVVLQVLTSPGGETWSIVIVHADGSACVSAAGRGWEPGALPPTKTEEPS